MSNFGDSDPEDAWDAGDSLALKLALLVRIIVHIQLEHADHGITPRHTARLANLARLIDTVS